MATTTISGSTVTFSNSTAAANLSTGLTENDAGSYAYAFDVLGASGGGAKTTLYSVDNGTAGDYNAPVTTNNGFATYDTDLLYADKAVDGWQPGGDTSALGAHVWIGKDNQVHYDASSISDMINGLGAGETKVDTFKYTIKLANGTLSSAR